MTGRRAAAWERWGPRVVAGTFVTSGVVHLVRPSTFDPLVPRFLPRRTDIIYGSGVAELVCAAGLLGRTRWGGPASAALLLAIWPGNLQMALDVTKHMPEKKAFVAAVWARMPLQLPLIAAALAGGRCPRD